MTLPIDGAASVLAGSPTPSPLHPFDAVLLLGFGGPERPEDVVPFLERVTRGRGIPRERLAEVGAHYFLFGGRSPINDQNRALLAALRDELDRRDLRVPLGWGNRNWDPFLVDGLRDLHEVGARRVVAIPTSAFSSYSGCRQYRENLAEALAVLRAEGRALEVSKVRHYFNHPGYVAAVTDAVRDAVAAVPAGVRDGVRLVFVTHSVPEAMDASSGPLGHAYSSQHRDVAAVVAERVRDTVAGASVSGWDLAFCSRSGPPGQPWLEPDVNDHLRVLAESGTPSVVLVPIGFVSDHMEVVYDLDTQARQTATDLDLPMVRAATAGTDARFVAGLVDLVVEAAAEARGEDVVPVCEGSWGPGWSRCPVGCCPNPRGERAAACGQDDPGLAGLPPQGPAVGARPGAEPYRESR